MKIEKECAYCGKPFLGTKKAIYCSPGHRVLGFRARTGQPIFPAWSGRSDQESILKNQIADLKAKISYLELENDGLQAKIGHLHDELAKREVSVPFVEIVPEIEQNKPTRQAPKPKKAKKMTVEEEVAKLMAVYEQSKPTV